MEQKLTVRILGNTSGWRRESIGGAV